MGHYRTNLRLAKLEVSAQIKAPPASQIPYHFTDLPAVTSCLQACREKPQTNSHSWHVHLSKPVFRSLLVKRLKITQILPGATRRQEIQARAKSEVNSPLQSCQTHLFRGCDSTPVQTRHQRISCEQTLETVAFCDDRRGRSTILKSSRSPP